MALLDQVLPRYPNRSETINFISKAKNYDLLVIGGGIHGATLAHQAALNGLKTVLLERHDYACATSSRSSKMAHGGLRYLEMLDFRQVFEGVHARETLYRTAGHLVKPHRFLIPIFKGENWLKFKLGLGLKLYDFMAGVKERRHEWLDAEHPECAMFRRMSRELIGCFVYWDGILNDSRLVVDRVVAARDEGALVLNHAEVTNILPLGNGRVLAHWIDNLTNRKYELDVGIVANCTGPWASRRGNQIDSALKNRLVYSKGVHLIFDVKWQGPALFLPLELPGRYYFVWPHLAGTMVGTTEREVTNLEDDPQPSREEVNEILTRLEHDLPGFGLDRSALKYAFAGVRTLPLRHTRRNKTTAALSRRHIWHYSRGVLTLLGGKFTTATATAEDGLREIFTLAEMDVPIVSLENRPLPGYEFAEDVVRRFRNESKKRLLPEAIVDDAVRKFGGRLAFVFENEDYASKLEEMFEIVAGKVLRGEIEIALQVEQAESLEDLVRRRLDLEYHHDHSFNNLDEIGEVMVAYGHDPVIIEEQKIDFRNRIQKLRSILNP